MTQKELIQQIDAWLTGKKSPMAGFSDFMVILARHFGVSLSLSIAVAQAETQCATDSNANQQDIQGHNAWGYGQQPGFQHGWLFPSWPDGINAVTERLAGFVHGTVPNYPPCPTVDLLSGVWVNGDVNKPSLLWAANVSFIVVKFGGDPNNLAKVPLIAAGSGTPPA
jgi:hypothetical protein